MTRALIAPLLLALLAGLAVPFQASANANLARALGHPLWAATAALTLAALMIALIAVWFPLPDRRALGTSPPWTWLGGACSVLFVCATIHSAPRLGAGPFSAIVFGGQLIAALVVDQTGWLDFPQRPLTLPKAVGAMLVVAGVVTLLASNTQSQSQA